MRAAAADRRLEAIAGSPGFVLNGNVTASGQPTGIAQAIGDPHMCYSVIDFTGAIPTTGVVNVLAIGETLNDGANNTYLTLRMTQNTGFLTARRTGGTGITATSPVPARRAVLAWGATGSSGNARGFVRTDTMSASVVDNLAGGAGPILASRARLYNNYGGSTAYFTHVSTYFYPGDHDDATRKRIMGWLSRRHGTPPPA